MASIETQLFLKRISDALYRVGKNEEDRLAVYRAEDNFRQHYFDTVY